MAAPLLEFTADDVAAETEEHTPECVVYTIAVWTGDPEAGGRSFNFSRSFDEDWGVCMVREIQRATVCEGMASFRLYRSGQECAFEPEAAVQIGFSELRIALEIGDQQWAELAATARTVFRDRAYFVCEE